MISDHGGVELITVVPLAIGMAELGLRLPFAEPRRQMQLMFSKSLRTMRAAASDHWKQRALLSYSSITFRASLSLLGNVAVLAAAAASAVLTIGLVIPSFDTVTFSVPGIILIFITASLYLLLRLGLKHG